MNQDQNHYDSQDLSKNFLNHSDDFVQGQGHDQEDSKNIKEILSEVDINGFKTIIWWMLLPKRERFELGDILYHMKFDRFGLFMQPARKENLIRMRLFKLSSKTKLYTRDWFIGFEDVILVKRGDHIKRGFAETDIEFVKRVGHNRMFKKEI